MCYRKTKSNWPYSDMETMDCQVIFQRVSQKLPMGQFGSALVGAACSGSWKKSKIFQALFLTGWTVFKMEKRASSAWGPATFFPMARETYILNLPWDR